MKLIRRADALRLSESLCSRRSLGYASPILGSPPVDYWNHSPAAEDRAMIIGERLRALREEKEFSQGEIEKRTGLVRSYISRVENGHLVPAVETLEKFARALGVPIYQLFYEGEEPPRLPNLAKRKSADDIAWGSKGAARRPFRVDSRPLRPESLDC